MIVSLLVISSFCIRTFSFCTKAARLRAGLLHLCPSLFNLSLLSEFAFELCFLAQPVLSLTVLSGLATSCHHAHLT
jgi:hypothetical protein